MQLTFLGTAGSWPTRERSASAIALDMEQEVVLLDCGEGTQRQFFQSPVSFMRVRRIFLSHFHGDHFLGVPGLIQSMCLNNRTEPLDIYGPRETRKFVDMMLNLGHFTLKFQVSAHELAPGDEVDLNTYTVRTARAKHSVPTIAVRVEEKMKRGRFDGEKARGMGIRGRDFARLEAGENVTVANGSVVTPQMVMGPARAGRSVVYSGDSAPEGDIVRLAKGADILIHESTAAKELEKDMNDWGHSTARQAAGVAVEAQVGTLFLTHFSARYPDPSPLEEEARASFAGARAARDLLSELVRQR
ncbi:MAG: ribonuclease Z [Euryarchaeota archaeon]|nr:ribonuclease Z [Euryarchaeota archaeon]MDE1836740.1 ribonuclease Z [Euryarchaeota archaeon]MDE1879758.1 ribonuclease Z [Euryarchaeota archaeon]MDE2044724.1 ribonuclease Z [Thermoplasmata archaeon]